LRTATLRAHTLRVWLSAFGVGCPHPTPHHGPAAWFGRTLGNASTSSVVRVSPHSQHRTALYHCAPPATIQRGRGIAVAAPWRGDFRHACVAATPNQTGHRRHACCFLLPPGLPDLPTTHGFAPLLTPPPHAHWPSFARRACRMPFFACHLLPLPAFWTRTTVTHGLTLGIGSPPTDFELAGRFGARVGTSSICAAYFSCTARHSPLFNRTRG